MNKLICLITCLAAAVGFGAYQYIISTDPELAVNPSETAYSAVVSVAARTDAEQSMETTLETRYRTFAESNTSGLDRRRPGIVIIFR